MPRKRATSLVVHQSSGSGSDTMISVQRLRCLVSAGALGPDDGNRDATLPRLGNHVGSTAIRSGRLAVPHGEQAIGIVQHGLAGRHMSFRGGLVIAEVVHRRSGR